MPQKEIITEPVAVPLDSVPERCTMTIKPDISTCALLILILRLGPLSLMDFIPQQVVRDRNVSPLDHMWQIPFVLTAQFRWLY